ncbi:MAG: VOC family protein [Myxococcota bacterium]
MAQNPVRTPQTIVPYLTYQDAPAAIEFLCKALGFEEAYRLEMGDGKIGHAQLDFAGNQVMLASCYPELGLQSPQDLDGVHCQVHIDVDDVDAHCAHAKSQGATIAMEPTDQPHGDRMYRVVDPEGHRWIFSTRLREMTPEEIRKAYEGA